MHPGRIRPSPSTRPAAVTRAASTSATRGPTYTGDQGRGADHLRQPPAAALGLPAARAAPDRRPDAVRSATPTSSGSSRPSTSRTARSGSASTTRPATRRRRQAYYSCTRLPRRWPDAGRAPCTRRPSSRTRRSRARASTATTRASRPRTASPTRSGPTRASCRPLNEEIYTARLARADLARGRRAERLCSLSRGERRAKSSAISSNVGPADAVVLVDVLDDPLVHQQHLRAAAHVRVDRHREDGVVLLAVDPVELVAPDLLEVRAG